MGMGGRPEASAAIWSWEEAQSRSQSASPASIRLRGAIRSLLGGGVGALVLVFGSRPMGTVILSVAGLLLFAALLSPTGIYAVAERALASFGSFAGRVMSWLILPVLFYGIFVPFGLVFRRGQKDALQRFFVGERESYWSDREGNRTASGNRERQY